MSYYFFLGNTMLPIPPKQLATRINGKNKTINLINDGEVNLIKETGLTDISFSFLLPNNKYPFANYDLSLQTGLIDYAIGEISQRFSGTVGNSYSFQKAETFLTSLKTAKEIKRPVRFIVNRSGYDYTMLWNTNLLCTVENYTIEDSVEYGTDCMVTIDLKQYKQFGTKEVEVIKNKDGSETLQIKENRYAPDTSYPAAMSITKEASILEACKGLSDGKLDWRAVAKRSGITNPLEPRLKGKVINFV